MKKAFRFEEGEHDRYIKENTAFGCDSLTLYEAYLYSGIGTNKLRELTQRPDCPFLIWYGRTRLIDRAELEKYVKSVNRL